MDIVFVRHGKAVLNEAGCFLGSTDCDITLDGINQAREIKNFLKDASFDAVYVSPLKRAVQTAEAMEREYSIDSRLREVDFGVFEGLKYKEIEERYPEYLKLWNEDYMNYRIPEGESLMEVFDRVEDFINDVRKRHERVLVVTHGGVIRCALSLAVSGRDFFYKFKVGHGSVSAVSFDGDYGFIKTLNCRGSILDI